MKSVFSFERWLSRSGAGPSAAPPEVALPLHGMDVQPAMGDPALELVLLIDTPALADAQFLLATIDSLALFAKPGAGLAVTVIHRLPPDAAMLALFDGVPKLSFQHLDYDAISSRPGSQGEFLHAWRHSAALLFARYCRSTFYLVLDTSCLCIRPLDIGTLIEAGRAVSQWEAPNTHPECLASAQDLLGVRSVPPRSLSTLPAVFSTALAQHTLQRLETAQSAGAEEVLIRASQQGRDWSANLLYSLAAGAALEQAHRPALLNEVLRALHSDVNIWGDETDLTGWDPAHWVQLTGHGQFLVAKSSDPQRSRVILSRCYGALHASPGV